MNITNEFRDAVESNNKLRVRIMLKDIILVDPSFATFNEMISFAEKSVDNLYDEHDGEVLNTDRSTWNEDYMNRQLVSVITNFSKERIQLLEEIVKQLYIGKIDSSENAPKSNVFYTSPTKKITYYAKKIVDYVKNCLSEDNYH